MIPIKVLIIEDEIPAQRLLQSMLDDLNDDIEVVGSLDSIQSSIKWLKNNPHPDLVLMDIQLSDGLSFEILNQTTIDSMIIFTTAFHEYAINAFKVNSIDYLIKPIDADELKAAFEKYHHFNKSFGRYFYREINFNEVASIIKNAEPNYRKRFLIQSEDGFFQLPVEEIAYFLTIQKTTFAVTFEQRKIPINFSLENLKTQLDPDEFFKINRQMIVNIKAITKIKTYFDGKLVIYTKPVNPEKIIVGKDKAASFKRWLDR